ncbi:hypothetical protein EPI10_006220 [Gossypium australe]|uniref:Uncharacterized protein n=1 Tax=Gossypium australe TaxID=47621 RepID=A0A5B6WRN0_9ROSI|nr:hypothetical protein EPI10_006220 [Gossypium australe]
MTRRERNSGLRIPSGISPERFSLPKGGTPWCRWCQKRELAGNFSKRNIGRSTSARGSSTTRGKSSWN